MPGNGHIHVCARCSAEFNTPNSYPPPGWVWRGSHLYCDACCSLVDDPIDDAQPERARTAEQPTPARDNVFAQANRYIEHLAKSLPRTEREALMQLREDGKGNYDPRLAKARIALHEKGLADSPMSLGFGRKLIACVQHPTALGRAVAEVLQQEAA